MKNVLITGAASGIGFELSKRFLSNGNYKVFMVDRDYDRLFNSFNEIKDINPDNIKCFTIDITDSSGVFILKKSIEEYGLDILINNAGVGLNGELIDTTLFEWDKLVRVNFLAPIMMVRRFFGLLEKSEGHIVNVSSGQVFFRLPSWGAYTATKNALSSYSELLGFELSKYKIKVSTIYPFMVNTPFYQGIIGDTFFAKIAMRFIPLYSDTPEKVADKIFKAVEKNKRTEYVNPINYLGIALRAFPPIANAFSYIATKLFIGRKK